MVSALSGSNACVGRMRRRVEQAEQNNHTVRDSRGFQRRAFSLVPPPLQGELTADVTPPPFYVYADAPAYETGALMRCVPRWAEDDQAAEVAMLLLLWEHPARVHEPEAARLFVVPALPYVSYIAGTCEGSTHEERMARLAAAVASSPWFRRRSGRDHLLVSNTFRFAAFRPLKRLLANATVGWFEQPSAAPAASVLHSYARRTWRCTVVVPYLENPYCTAGEIAGNAAGAAATTATAAAGGGAGAGAGAGLAATAVALTSASPSASRSSVRLGEITSRSGVFFQGSWSAAQWVRGRFAELQGLEGVHVSDVPRGGQPASSGVDASKLGTARAYQQHAWCLVPKGDTSSSGRLFSALACGCVPLLISAKLPPHLPYRRIARYEQWLPALHEEAFKEAPRQVLTTALVGLTPRWAELHDRMESARTDLLYRAPGSRVATNLLREWQHSCA